MADLREEGSMINYILVKHRVKSFPEWKKVYDAHLLERIEAGLAEKYLFRGIDNLNDVIIVFETTDLARAKAFLDASETRESREKGGVVDRPEIYFLNEPPDALAKASGF
jgi:hypothetical protein